MHLHGRSRKKPDSAAIVARGAGQGALKTGSRVSLVRGRLAMETRSLEQLGDEIAELSAHLDAATVRLLDLIREFDIREGWGNGFRSCAAWLSWRVGLDLGAARERVRVARALETLPRLAQALGRGELSYAKVRALTRVATPETEERLLAVGRAGTADHVERIVRGWRLMDRKAEARRGRHGNHPRAACPGGRCRTHPGSERRPRGAVPAGPPRSHRSQPHGRFLRDADGGTAASRRAEAGCGVGAKSWTRPRGTG